MAYLETKTIRGQEYYYLVEKQRVGDRLRKTKNVYLGTPKRILERIEGRTPPRPARLLSYPFGRVATLCTVADSIDLIGTIDQSARPSSRSGLSVGQYAMVTILGRAHAPWSKAATGRWWDRECFLRFVWNVPSRVNSYNLLHNLRRLADPGVQARIEHALSERLIQEGLKPSRLFWDLTNWSNYIEEGERLPQTGYPKDRRYDLNLVGLGLAITEERIPFLHETVPGDSDEHKVFARAVDRLATRLIQLELDPRQMTLVFDRGPNSTKNVAKATDLMHVVGGLPPTMVPDLMQLDLGEFTPIEPTRGGHPLRAYRTRRELFEQPFHVLVTYNAATAERKKRTYERYARGFREGMAALMKGGARTKGRPLGYEAAAASAAALVFDPYRTVFRYRIEENPRRFTYEVNAEAKERLLKRFGRRAYFTDLDLAPAEVVKLYEERTKVEQEFRAMKGDELMPFDPLYVRRDVSIRAHAFLIVLGLLLWRLAFRTIHQARIEAGEGELLEAMDELKVALVADQSRGRVRSGQWILEQRGPLADRLVSALHLDARVPK